MFSKGHPFDKKQAEYYLNQLDPSTATFAFQAFHFDKTRPNSGLLHGTLDELWPKLCRLNKDGYGVYVTVNETDGLGRKIKNVTGVRAVWQEDDGAGKKLPIKPHLVIETSPGHYHRYLLVDQEGEVSKEEFDNVMDRLVVKYGCDKNAKDLTRVLRLPGMYNVKRSLTKPFLVNIKKSRDKDRLPWKTVQKIFMNGHAVELGIEKETSVIAYGAYIKAIVEAKEYYQPILSLTMRMANTGSQPDATIALVKTALDMAKAARPNQDMEIWQQRYDGVEAMAWSAFRKRREEAGDVGVQEFLNATVSGKDLTKETVAEVKYLLAPIITDSSINMIHATRGLGKTYLAMSLAAALGIGADFLKWTCGGEGVKVLYVDGELPYPRLKDQMNTAGAAVGNPECIGVDFMTGDKMPGRIFPDITEGDNQNSIDAVIMKGGYKAVVFDNIATLFKTAELKQESWKSVQDWLISLRSRGVSSVVIHHDNKAADAQRGFSNKEDVMDTILHLRRSAGAEADGAKFTATFNKHRYFGGGDARQFRCELSVDGGGWVVSDIHQDKAEQVVEMLKEGYIGKEIANVVKCSEAYVAKIKKAAIEAGAIEKSKVADGRSKNSANNFDAAVEPRKFGKKVVEYGKNKKHKTKLKKVKGRKKPNENK